MPVDSKKTKQELIAELEASRRRIAELECRPPAATPYDATLVLRSVLEALSGLILVLDPDLRVVMSNWKEHDFVTEEERRSNPFCYSSLKRLDAPCANCMALQTFKDGKPRQGEDVNPVDGSQKAVSIIPLLDDAGQVYAVVEYVQDITERKRARQDLERLFDISSDLICMADIQSQTFTRVNPAFTKLLGYTEQELLDRPFNSFVHPDDREQTAAIVEKKLKSGKQIIDFENRYICKDGGIRWLSWVSCPEIERGTTYAMARDVTEYKKAKQKLEQESLKYRQLFEMESDALFLIDSRSGEILEANPSAEAMYGYSVDELLGMRNVDLSAQPQETTQATHTKVNLIPIRYHKKRDGSVFPVEISASHFTWKNRKVHLAAIRDISQRMEAERELKESEERYALALKGTNDGIWDWDRVTNSVYFSPRWKEIIGYQDHEIENRIKEWLTRIHPDDLQEVLDANNAFYHSDDELFEIQYRMIHKDGSIRWILGRGTCIRDENGEPIRMVGAHSDITIRKQAEEELWASQKRLAQIIDFMPDAALVIDKDGRVIAWNKAIEKLSGVAAEDMLGKSNYEYAVPFYGERRPLLVDHVLTPGKDLHESYEKFSRQNDIVTAENTVIHPDNTETALWGTAAVLRDASGSIIGAIECIRDITEIKNYEQTLKKAKEDAEAANTAKSEFLANMSHEIRTPLNGILGMLQLLRTTPLDDEQLSYVRTAMFSGKSLLSVINDILDFSKIEAGKTELRSELFEPATLLATVAETFEPQAAGKGITLRHFVSGNVPAKLLGDEGRIRQILFNLLGNAVKFTDKGEVRVNLDAEIEQDDRLRLICNIEDTGMGISDEVLHKVFEPFTQVDGTLTRKHQGSGLGLSIVKRLATLMGGDVSMRSRVGRGTVVSFDVLAQTAQTGEAETGMQDPPLPADHTSGLHILVAEDNPVSQIFTAKILEKIGHRPTVVANGEQVLDALARQNYDLVLMDVQMPLMDGIEATAKIRAHSGDGVDPNIPIVAMTAHAMQGDREKCLKAGMDGYVSKPVDMDELTTTISRIAADQKRCN